GIPVSTSHSIVGAIFGVGLATGIKALNLRLVRDIFVTWAVTPVVAGAISWAVVKLVVLFM
ncbi:MAG TPA: inorganic phosphate transporter, partial [bacterium]|nr:inorganic phosphate transporter [bacterium]